MDDYFDEFDGPQRTPMDDLINATISNGADIQRVTEEVERVATNQEALHRDLIDNVAWPQLEQLREANRWLRRIAYLLGALIVIVLVK